MTKQVGLKHKTVVVLGGSSGIGLGVAQLAASEGARVVIASSKAERVGQALRAIGGDAQGQVLNAMDEGAVKSFFVNQGAFDHLVFTAGDSVQFNALHSIDLQEARSTFELRYWSALAAVKYGSPLIREGGSIVLTTGITSLRPMKGWVVVSSVCGSMDSLTRALAVELAPIRVNAVSPGVIRTNFWKDMSEEQQVQFYENTGKSLPVGRVGTVEETAQAYVYLMSNGFATGQVLVVDGGTVLV
jgi:NAD(P)-dependent dehydrogenase (short-subunit alcohol dehydrogenase family)